MAGGIPHPPRMTGDAATDLRAIIYWSADFYRVAILENTLLQAAQQIVFGTFNPASLPDPASTTLARAQQTANEAYTLANSANITALAASAAATAAQSTANTASTSATLANTKAGIQGQVTISDAATTGALTLTPAQADTTYFVTVTATAITGAPLAAAYTIKTVTKLVGSVTIELVAAPGVGTSITFDIQVQRNS